MSKETTDFVAPMGYQSHHVEAVQRVITVVYPNRTTCPESILSNSRVGHVDWLFLISDWANVKQFLQKPQIIQTFWLQPASFRQTNQDNIDFLCDFISLSLLNSYFKNVSFSLRSGYFQLQSIRVSFLQDKKHLNLWLKCCRTRGSNEMHHSENHK